MPWLMDNGIVITPDTTSIDRREHSEGDIPGGFPLEEEPPVTNGTHDEEHVEEEEVLEENSLEEQREISEVPTQTQGETPEASPPPTPAESRAESISLSVIRDTTVEPTIASRMSTPASISPRKGSYRKPVLQHRTHPLKKRVSTSGDIFGKMLIEPSSMTLSKSCDTCGSCGYLREPVDIPKMSVLSGVSRGWYFPEYARLTKPQIT